MFLSTEIKSRIKKQQTEILTDYIRKQQVTHLSAYLNYLTIEGQSLTDAVNFSPDDNFLTDAVKTNNPEIVRLLLTTLNKNKTEDIRNQSIVLFALAYAQSDAIALQLYKYLNEESNLASIVTVYCLAAFKISIHVNNQPGPTISYDLIINNKPEAILIEGPCIENRAGRYVIENLFINYYKRKHDKASLFIIFLFQYAVMNNRFILAKYILNISTQKQTLAEQSNNAGLSLAHQCLGNKNYEGIIFLAKQGAHLHPPQSHCISSEEQSSEPTVIQLMIRKKDHDGLRTLLKEIMTLTGETEIHNCLHFLEHLINVYTDCEDVSILKIFDEFGFAKLLRQRDTAPEKAALPHISNQVYLAITPLLQRYYGEKLQRHLLTEEQLPLIRERMLELDSLLEVLNECHTSKISSFSFCLICFNNYINNLPKNQRDEITYAITKLKNLGFSIEGLKIPELIKEFEVIKGGFTKDIIQFENLKSPFHNYPTDMLAESLLMRPRIVHHHRDGAELMHLTGSLRTRLLDA